MALTPSSTQVDLSSVISGIKAGENLHKLDKENHFSEARGRAWSTDGHPTGFLAKEEQSIAQHVVLHGNYGYDFDMMELQLIIKSFLDNAGLTIGQFKGNLPGIEWVKDFIMRHKDLISKQVCQGVIPAVDLFNRTKSFVSSDKSVNHQGVQNAAGPSGLEQNLNPNFSKKSKSKSPERRSATSSTSSLGDTEVIGNGDSCVDDPFIIEDVICNNESEEEVIVFNVPVPDTDKSELERGDYVLIKFASKKHVFHYVGKLDKLGDDAGTWKIYYLRRYYNDDDYDSKNLTFVNPFYPDYYITDTDDIIAVLPKPNFVKDKMLFPVHLFTNMIVR